MQIPEQNPECVSNAPICVPEACKDFFRERHVGRVIDATGPKSQQIGAVFAHEMIGSGGFLIRGGLGDLLPVHVDHETVSHTYFVWGTLIQRDTGHQRRLKPAAMLVGGLQIHVGRIAQLGMHGAHRLM